MTSGGEFRKWQLLTREDIPDRDVRSRVYLTRWRIVQTPWFALYLHCIRLPDADENLHDHPWSFVSVVLRGGYVERRPHYVPREHSDETRGFLSVAFRRATDLHRIVRLTRSPTWTLLFVGRRTRRWGFQTENGWVNYVKYLGLDKEGA